ncbi:MAG: hypothetical protein WBF32_10805 [Candidatus Aminicenantaceae bacterium]
MKNICLRRLILDPYIIYAKIPVEIFFDLDSSELRRQNQPNRSSNKHQHNGYSISPTPTRAKNMLFVPLLLSHFFLKAIPQGLCIHTLALLYRYSLNGLSADECFLTLGTSLYVKSDKKVLPFIQWYE